MRRGYIAAEGELSGNESQSCMKSTMITLECAQDVHNVTE